MPHVKITRDDSYLNRQMLDSLREILGLSPLYRAERETEAYIHSFKYEEGGRKVPLPKSLF